MDDLTPILDLVYNRYNLDKLDKINILEIGTGEGKNSTKILYNFFLKKKNSILFHMKVWINYIILLLIIGIIQIM